MAAASGGGLLRYSRSPLNAVATRMSGRPSPSASIQAIAVAPAASRGSITEWSRNCPPPRFVNSLGPSAVASNRSGRPSPL